MYSTPLQATLIATRGVEDRYSQVYLLCFWNLNLSVIAATEHYQNMTNDL